MVADTHLIWLNVVIYVESGHYPGNGDPYSLRIIRMLPDIKQYRPWRQSDVYNQYSKYLW